MAAEVKKEIALEIAHVLFIDIVAYSRMATDDQRAAIDELNQIVQSTDEYRQAQSENRLLKLATGDGMALIFYHSPEDPVECALEISRAIKSSTQICGCDRAHAAGKRCHKAVASFNISPLRQRGRARRSLPCSNWKLDCVLPPHRPC